MRICKRCRRNLDGGSQTHIEGLARRAICAKGYCVSCAGDLITADEVARKYKDVLAEKARRKRAKQLAPATAVA